MECGHSPTVKLLLERGATVDYRQPHGGNVFHVAAEMGRDDVGQLTLERAAKNGLATLMALITMKDKRCVSGSLGRDRETVQAAGEVMLLAWVVEMVRPSCALQGTKTCRCRVRIQAARFFGDAGCIHLTPTAARTAPL